MLNTNKYGELFYLLSNGFHGAKLGKKVSQKMFYFFERRGIALNLRYGIHYYGPYSARLDNVMRILESDGYLTIDTSGSTHIISVQKKAKDEAALSAEERETATSVIRDLAQKSASALEALATMDYVAVSLTPPDASDAEIMAKFKEIKGTKFNQNEIETALAELKRLHFVA